MLKIKILHIHTLPVISGSGINTLLTMRGTDKNKYTVEFACAPGGALVDEATKSGIKFQPIKNFVQPVSPYNDLIALWQMIVLMRNQKYDIVHSHNSKAGFIGRLAAKIAGVPIVIHTVHGFAFHGSESFMRRKLFTWLERWAAHFADKLIVISNPLREWGLSLNIGKRQQYVTIYSGIEIDKFRVGVDVIQKKKELGINKDDLVLGVASKLWEGKGHRCILHALKQIIVKIPKVKLLFVGEGPLQEELAHLTNQLGLSDFVIFTGFRDDIPEVTATFDVAILASFFEGMGRVLLEAMAQGKPVVATRVGGIPDVVDDEVTGILVPPHDVSALSGAMIRLLENKELRIKMGQAGSNKIDVKFTALMMVEQIQAVYEDAISQKDLRK